MLLIHQFKFISAAFSLLLVTVLFRDAASAAATSHPVAAFVVDADAAAAAIPSAPFCSHCL
jgi:hypothetical protein